MRDPTDRLDVDDELSSRTEQYGDRHRIIMKRLAQNERAPSQIRRHDLDPVMTPVHTIVY
jgi:hypothetical protein